MSRTDTHRNLCILGRFWPNSSPAGRHRARNETLAASARRRRRSLIAPASYCARSHSLCTIDAANRRKRSSARQQDGLARPTNQVAGAALAAGRAAIWMAITWPNRPRPPGVVCERVKRIGAHNGRPARRAPPPPTMWTMQMSTIGGALARLLARPLAAGRAKPMAPELINECAAPARTVGKPAQEPSVANRARAPSEQAPRGRLARASIAARARASFAGASPPLIVIVVFVFVSVVVLHSSKHLELVGCRQPAGPAVVSLRPRARPAAILKFGRRERAR
jgi:hypothetical protein